MENIRYYIPRFFKPQELLPPEMYDPSKPDEINLIVMDHRILWTIDMLAQSPELNRPVGKDHCPIICNNYATGGPFSQRGFRSKIDPLTPRSQHYFGRAIDIDIWGMLAIIFRDMVRAGKFKHELQYITRIEDTKGGQPITWIHLDVGAWPGQEINFMAI
jgi:hypothetical protein